MEKSVTALMLECVDCLVEVVNKGGAEPVSKEALLDVISKQELSCFITGYLLAHDMLDSDTDVNDFVNMIKD